METAAQNKRQMETGGLYASLGVTKFTVNQPSSPAQLPLGSDQTHPTIYIACAHKFPAALL